MKKLRILQYDHSAPLQEGVLHRAGSCCPLKQGAGSASQALVKPGDQVNAGQLLGAIPDKVLGAVIHAPLPPAWPRSPQPHRANPPLSKPPMNEKSVGMIELSSVAAGFQVADTMLKAGNVRLYLSRSICSGKFMVLIGGDASAVESAVAAGSEAATAA